MRTALLVALAVVAIAALVSAGILAYALRSQDRLVELEQRVDGLQSSGAAAHVELAQLAQRTEELEHHARQAVGALEQAGSEIEALGSRPAEGRAEHHDRLRQLGRCVNDLSAGLLTLAEAIRLGEREIAQEVVQPESCFGAG